MNTQINKVLMIQSEGAYDYIMFPDHISKFKFEDISNYTKEKVFMKIFFFS